MTPIDPTTTLPKNLKSYLSYPTTPWQISPGLFGRIRQKADEAGSTPDEQPRYKKCEVLPTDPEAEFVKTYFLHQKPTNYTISKVFCMHKPATSQAFESKIEKMDQQAHTIKPEWDQEGLKTQREEVVARWKEQANQFYPLTIEREDRTDSYLHVRVLPLWHGTSGKVCHSVASSSFLVVGNQHFFNPDAKAGSVKKTDPGYFGNGIYFTSSAKYAAMYSSGHLLMTWVSMREPFPVVNDVPHPSKGKDMQMLYGTMGYQTYNAHYIPVAPISNTPGCMKYYPCYQNQAPVCDEIVVFQDDQTLPRFWVELMPELLSQPSILTTPITSTLQGGITTTLTTSTTHASVTTLTTTTTTTTTLSLTTTTTSSTSPIKANASSSMTPSKTPSPASSTSKKTEPLELNLWTACEAGDLAFVKSTIRSWWINKKEKINQADGFQNTPLILATKGGHLEVVRFLLESRASPHDSDAEEYLPLHWAAKIGSLDLVKLLVIKGANVNVTGLYQRTPLHMAAHNGQAHVVAWLLSVRASINAKAGAEDNSTTPLHEAVIRGHLGVVQILGADPTLNVNLPDSNQQAPLYYAVLNGDLDMIQTLTKHKSWCNPSHSNHPNHLSQLLKLSPAKNKAAIQAYLATLNKPQLTYSAEKKQ